MIVSFLFGDAYLYIDPRREFSKLHQALTLARVLIRSCVTPAHNIELSHADVKKEHKPEQP